MLTSRQLQTVDNDDGRMKSLYMMKKEEGRRKEFLCKSVWASNFFIYLILEVVRRLMLLVNVAGFSL